LKNYETTANEVEEQIIAMYAKGMSTRDIEDHMRDIYGIEVSATMVSKVTDKILPMIAEWQARPLDRVYPVIFLDAIHFKVRKDNRIINKAAYSVLAINMDVVITARIKAVVRAEAVDISLYRGNKNPRTRL
jgi:putative transposase